MNLPGRDSENGRILMPNLVTLMKNLLKCHLQSLSPESHLFWLKTFEIQFRHNVMTNLKFIVASCETLQWQRCIRLSQAPLPLLTSLKRLSPTLDTKHFKNSFQTMTTVENKISWKGWKIQMRHARAWNLSKSAFHSGDPKPNYSNTTQPMTRAVWNFYLLLFSGWMENTKKNPLMHHIIFSTPVKLIWCPYKTTH